MANFKNPIQTLAVAVFSLTVLGCASGGGGEGMSGRSNVRMDMGAATSTDMLEVTQDLLRRQQFPVFRTDQAPVPLVQSEWRNHTPFEDELAQGVSEVRCRVIVRGRERPPQGSFRTYQVTYDMEVQVKIADSMDWIEIPVTPQRTRMAQELGRELRLALEVVRKFQ